MPPHVKSQRAKPMSNRVNDFFAPIDNARDDQTRFSKKSGSAENPRKPVHIEHSNRGLVARSRVSLLRKLLFIEICFQKFEIYFALTDRSESKMSRS